MKAIKMLLLAGVAMICACQPSPKSTACKKLLLLVDVQYDFITGSLAVEGAPAVMDGLAEYIAGEPHGTFDAIVLTADYHPANHSSFKDNGGIWPAHCVQNTEGAAIYKAVLDAVKQHDPEAQVLTKGDNVAVDEYSILANEVSAKKLLALIEEKGIQEIYVAGLCGDYCVGNSIKDLVSAGHGDKIRVLTRYIGNIDDGTTLRSIIAENNLQVAE
ncbi:MAG: isochorismatase family protein [Bacteroidaceae bacterium]|nr:isochorismatase family protein [Bacteroidaceae bacterium]